MTKDIEVHIQIARISKNTKVIQMISDLGDQLIRTSVLSLQYGDLPIEEYPSRHMRLLECLRKKDYDVGRETLKRTYCYLGKPSKKDSQYFEGRSRRKPDLLKTERSYHKSLKIFVKDNKKRIK